MVVQSLKMAWSAITGNKMRSFLTMLGIIIGVTSLVVLVSLVNGATSSVTDSISSLGTSMLSVTISDAKGNPYSWQDVLKLADEKEFSEASPLAQASVTAKNGTESDSMTVYGTTAGYASIKGLEIGKGRFLKKADNESHVNVAVVNSYTEETLFGKGNSIGQTISLNGKKYKIIGVLKEEESSSSGFNSEQMEAYIPYTSLMRLSDSVKDVTSFLLSASSEKEMDTADSKITNILLERFENDEDAFSVVNSSEMMETMQSVTNTMSLMLGGIAGISLIVGGIGIFLSWLIILIAGKIVTTMTFSLSMGIVWIAVAFSACIGVGFGIYPANKAAKKKPIEALRFS